MDWCDGRSGLWKEAGSQTESCTAPAPSWKGILEALKAPDGVQPLCGFIGLQNDLIGFHEVYAKTL